MFGTGTDGRKPPWVFLQSKKLRILSDVYMGVSQNTGTPKWMVYNGKPYEQMADLGGTIILETPFYAEGHYIHCPIQTMFFSYGRPIPQFWP